MIDPAELYETFYVPAIFAPLAERLVAWAAPQPGETVLDVACGTGVVARRVAPLVGGSGRVVGVDLNPRMLATARKFPVEEGAAIEWRAGDAAEVDLPAGSVDLITCQQGLQFFPDRAAALRHFRNLLAPGGRLCLAAWRSLEHHPLWRAMCEIEARHLEPLGIPREDIVAPFSLGEDGAIEQMLDEGSFSLVRMEHHTVQGRFPRKGFVARNEGAYAAVIPAFAEDPAAFEAFVAAVENDAGPLLDTFFEGAFVCFDMPTHLALAKP